MRILLIDDNPSNIYTFRKYWSNKQVECHIAVNTTTVLEQIKENEYDIIICELVMPHISGLEILTILKEEGIQTPFYLTSTINIPELILTAFELGITDFIEKPCNWYEIDLKIQKLIIKNQINHHQSLKMIA